MKRLVNFFILLIRECKKDEVFPHAGELTYRLVLSIFPTMIFVMSVMGFLNLDITPIALKLQDALPEQMISLFEMFDKEVLSQRSVSLLSTSLIFTVFSASSGFMGIIRGINKSYSSKENRGFIHQRLLSVGLVLIFTASIILCVLTIIFRDGFSSFISNFFDLPEYSSNVFSALTTMAILILLVFTVMLIYKLSNCERQSLLSVLPGALISVVSWVAASMCFKFYISNFARYSIIYGSIGGVIILLLWLNIMSLVLLIGNEVNAILDISKIKLKHESMLDTVQLESDGSKGFGM